MLEFTASKVQVYKDDDTEVIVGLYGTDAAGKTRYVELALVVRTVRGVYHFSVRAEVGRPKRVGTDCVAAAGLTRSSFVATFTTEGSLAKIGRVRVAFTADAKAYRDLKRGLQDVFCESSALTVAPVKAK